MVATRILLNRVLGAFAALGVAFVLLVLYGIHFQPRLDAASFRNDWTARFQSYQGHGEIPPEWANEVCVRRFGGDDWVLSALHHGTCAPGPRGSFNASVTLDSRGRISTCDWAPCAGDPQETAKAWEASVPGLTLDEFYHNLEQRGKITVVEEKPKTP